MIPSKPPEDFPVFDPANPDDTDFQLRQALVVAKARWRPPGIASRPTENSDFKGAILRTARSWKRIMIDEAENPTASRWLVWAREIQALAQTGLAFTRDQYDRERYQQLRALAAQIMAESTPAWPNPTSR